MHEPGPTGQNPNSFVISQKFENVFNGDELQIGEGTEHFNITWRIRILPKPPIFTIDLDSFVDPAYLKWNMETEIEWKFLTKNEEMKTIFRTNYSISSSKKTEKPSISFDWKSHSDCFIDDSLTVEAHVWILKTDGFGRKRFRKFDENSMKMLSDVVLVVDEERFWVSKLFLAAQAPFFKTFLHLEESSESGTSSDTPTTSESQNLNSGIPEFQLEDVDANDFQAFLEVLYGEISIDDDNVGALLNLAERYGAATVTKKCEHFLLSEESELSSLKHLELAIRFNLEGLKTQRLADIITVYDLHRILPENLAQLESPVMAALFEKVITFF